MRHLVGGGVGGFWLLHRLKSKDKPMCTVLDEAKDKPMDIVLSRKINPCVLSRAARGLEAASDRLLLDITLAMFPGPANVCRCLSAPHHTTEQGTSSSILHRCPGIMRCVISFLPLLTSV